MPEAPVEEHAGTGGDEREEDERRGDVVRLLAKDGREQAGAQDEGRQAQRPNERTSQLPPCLYSHSLPICPVAGAPQVHPNVVEPRGIIAPETRESDHPEE
jgi:hypothetical protein